jgi:hypothetical protein
MEEHEVREMGGSRSSGAWAAVAAGLAVVAACALGGPALAQQPPEYPLPPAPTRTASPTATPTPTPTPSQPPARPARLSPFPRVRTAGSFTDTRTTFTRVTVRAPRGARLDARCKPRRCPRVRRRITSDRTRRLKALQRSYPPRTTIEFRISSPTMVGKFVRIRTVRGAPPVRVDRCLAPGGSKPVRCEDA